MPLASSTEASMANLYFEELQNRNPQRGGPLFAHQGRDYPFRQTI